METNGYTKLLEIIKEKVSTKQIVAVIGIIVIGWKVDATPEMKCWCITGIVAMNYVAQSILDYFKGAKNETNSNNLIGGNTPD